MLLPVAHVALKDAAQAGVHLARQSRRRYAAGRVETEEVADCIRPDYVLPGAYEMPVDQLPTRRREAGAKKWTAKRQLKALNDISNGKVPEVLDPRLVAPEESVTQKSRRLSVM